MENWTAGDERPHNLTPLTSSFPWTVVFLLLFAAALGGYWYFFLNEKEKPVATPAPQASSTPQEQPKAEPAVRHPLAEPKAEAGAKPLPALDQSDTMMRDTLSSLMGAKPFSDMVVPTEMVRRIVATVDNLPREVIAPRLNPLKPPGGRFATSGNEDDLVIGPRNALRYEPAVRLFEATDTAKLVELYRHFYPLFQNAYVELGYPNGYFNDRLVEVIDHLLEAPEPKEPVRLVQPKVMYEFADPEMESLSSGRKILVRMGPENEARVKKKLRELREKLVEQGKLGRQ